MISLYHADRAPECAVFLDCPGPSAAAMLLAIALVLGELAVVAAILRNHVPVWYSLVGLGLLSMITAFGFGIASAGTDARNDLSTGLAIWHVVFGLILLVAGMAAAFW